MLTDRHCQNVSVRIPIFCFLPFFMALLTLFFCVQIHSGILSHCLVNTFFCTSACWQLHQGSRRLRPKGILQHLGTSCLVDAAPVVRLEKTYAQTRAAVTWDGCWLWDLIFGCTRAPFKLFLGTLFVLC